jgi:hypothetical protein
MTWWETALIILGGWVIGGSILAIAVGRLFAVDINGRDSSAGDPAVTAVPRRHRRRDRAVAAS